MLHFTIGVYFEPIIIHFNGFINLQSYIEKLVREAYARWNELEEIDGVNLNDNVALLTQGMFCVPMQKLFYQS